MKSTFCFVLAGATAVAALGATAVYTQNTKDTKTAKNPPAKKAEPGAGQEMPLPPGWTQEDMQACVMAGTPGPMQTWLNESNGTWTGKSTMWMTPDTPPMTSDCSSVASPVMDGRYTKCEMAGEMPGMGPFSGFALYGYDNVAKQFQSCWIDNCGTGIMFGTGVLSPDKKTLTWTMAYNCPLAKKQVTMREVDQFVDKDTRVISMYGPYFKTGKEFKMMEIKMTRKPGVATTKDAE